MENHDVDRTVEWWGNAICEKLDAISERLDDSTIEDALRELLLAVDAKGGTRVEYLAQLDWAKKQGWAAIAKKAESKEV